jgi:hypothetical protein
MVLESAARLRVPASRCVVIGDIGADVEAADAAGARAILVPTSITRADEVARATEVAPDLSTAVTWALGGSWRTAVAGSRPVFADHGHVGSNGDATTSSRISTSAGAASA